MKHFLSCALLAILCACGGERPGEPESIGPFRIGVLPDDNEAILAPQYAPLLDYLESALSVDTELFIPASYDELLDVFDAERLDLVWLGGLTFVQAEQRSQAVPLVSRDLDLRFTSCYLVRSSEMRQNIGEFEGAEFAFGPKLSTSGHLMPRQYLLEKKIVPEQFFGSVRHAIGHDQTAAWVRDGTISIGVANCVIVQSMFLDGRLNRDEIRVLETTPPFVNYVWAVQAGMDANIKLSVLTAFLALDASNAEHRAILRLLGGNAFMPVTSDDFKQTRTAAINAGMLPEAAVN